MPRSATRRSEEGRDDGLGRSTGPDGGGSAMMKLIRTLALLLAVAGCVGGAMAQGPSGTINGTVHDTTGAVVPGGTVSVTETETNVSHQTVANAQGAYSFALLPIGNYTLKVDAPTFKSY